MPSTLTYVDSIDDDTSSVRTNPPTKHMAATKPQQLILTDPLALDTNPGVKSLQNQGVENPGKNHDDSADNVNEDDEENIDRNPTESDQFCLAEDQVRA
jgi:hypothetical protein